MENETVFRSDTGTDACNGSSYPNRILYFGKLGEDKNGIVYDGDTNILSPVFEQQFKKLNFDYER